MSGRDDHESLGQRPYWNGVLSFMAGDPWAMRLHSTHEPQFALLDQQAAAVELEPAVPDGDVLLLDDDDSLMSMYVTQMEDAHELIRLYDHVFYDERTCPEDCDECMAGQEMIDSVIEEVVEDLRAQIYGESEEDDDEA